MAVKGHGTIGLITYLRTDSTRISQEADAECKEFIRENYGAENVMENAARKKETKKIQDAHEAIRPTYVNLTPAVVKDSLSRDQFRLYQLIWKRFVASRMNGARYETTSVKISAGNYRFTSSGSKIVFPGFLSVYQNDEDKAENNAALHKVAKGDVFKEVELKKEQHFTQPPAHYTEASLVKELEDLGIGRPSTYAPTISTLISRRYLAKENKNLYLSDLGDIVNRIMVSAFPSIVDVNFTATMETLLDGGNITVNIDEQIVFDQLEQNEDAVWSLLLAGGYLKVENLKYEGITREPWYTLSITNLETISMFTNMFKGWFGRSLSNYNAFVKALIQGDVDAMNYYMQRVCMATFSYFDVGSGQGADCEPERFYHGFVLGLMADQADIYETRSNRESGFGRYDVMLIPRDRKRQGLPAVIMEFKVHNSRQEADLEATVQAALSQIEEKNYDAELLGRGFEKEQIRHYGFAFKGKEVLIG